jgi:hypothetical protein
MHILILFAACSFLCAVYIGATGDGRTRPVAIRSCRHAAKSGVENGAKHPVD